MPVGRRYSAFLVPVPCLLRQPDRDATGKSHVALIIEQALTGEAHGDQRRRARGLNVDARPFQVQLVRYARGEVVLIIAYRNLNEARLPANRGAGGTVM